MARENVVKVLLTDAELGQLDELRGSTPRAIFLRHLLQHPPEVDSVASRDEALAILSSLAREGRVSAAIALARELRGDEPPSGDGSLLDRILNDAS